ncbi:MAG: radical SAM protein [Thermoplasmatota archaeon]
MPPEDHTTARPALLWTREGDSARCGLCERRCRIPIGGSGFCRVRRHEKCPSPPSAGAPGDVARIGGGAGGALLTHTYGNLSAIESRPIEIKPFYHYWPGSRALTFSTWSCNLSCDWCQNHHLSRRLPSASNSMFVPPERLVEWAVGSGDRGLCASFQEPTLLYEYCLDLFPLARRRGLYCCFVSNGYMTSEALEGLVRAGLDGLKIDIKGGAEVYRRHCGGADAMVPWRRAEEGRRMGLHIELVNLLVTDLNDGEDDVRTVVEEHLRRLGPDAPLHFTRYHPAHRFHRPPTPPSRLERARELARRAGVRFPYVGNLPGHRWESTWCPSCGRLLVLRDGPQVLEYLISRDNTCPRCGERVPVTGTGDCTGGAASLRRRPPASGLARGSGCS